MQTIRNLCNRWTHPKTLTGICMTRLCVYVIYVILINQIFVAISDTMWKQTFPEITDYISYAPLLARDEFKRIPFSRFKNCGIMIYGEQGRVIYATDSELRLLVSPEELEFIPDLNDNHTYRVVDGADGDTWVFRLEETGEEEGYSEVRDFCHIDSSYHIIEGELFTDLEDQLNKRTLGFLQGIYSQNRSIQRYSYTNINDRARTLVFWAPASTPKMLEEYAQRERLLWLVSLFFDILGALVIALLIARRVRLSILPLNALFESYRTEQKIDTQVVIPEELASVEQNFILLTEKLEISNAHRIEMEQEKNRMIADLSHDLKSPLTVISGFSEALQTGKVQGEDAAKYLEIIRKKSAISVGMINNLMQYATMEHPDYSVQKELVDICEFLRVCLISRYDELEEQNFELELDIPDEPIYYEIDRRILGSVMENLINNTIRYNEGGATVFLFLEKTTQELIVSFADNGVGISEEIRKDVFKPFVIGNQARTSGKGTGIGMSIIKRGVEMHGGTVELLNPAGTPFSTLFEMRFPLA